MPPLPRAYSRAHCAQDARDTQQRISALPDLSHFCSVESSAGSIPGPSPSGSNAHEVIHRPTHFSQVIPNACNGCVVCACVRACVGGGGRVQVNSGSQRAGTASESSAQPTCTDSPPRCARYLVPPCSSPRRSTPFTPSKPSVPSTIPLAVRANSVCVRRARRAQPCQRTKARETPLRESCHDCVSLHHRRSPLGIPRPASPWIAATPLD